MNVSDIMRRAKRVFGDESGVQLQDSDIIDWINDAQRSIAAGTELLQVTAHTDMIQGQSIYEKPATFLNLRSLRIYGYELKGIAMKQADQWFPGYDDPLQQTIGKPEYYWSWSDFFSIYPIPQETIAQGITIYYTRTPVLVSLLTDVPELPEMYHDRILDYVLRNAYEMDENYPAANLRQTLFNTGMQNLAENENKVNDDSYEVISVRPEDM